MLVLMCPMAPQAPHFSYKRKSISMSEVSTLHDVSSNIHTHTQGGRETKTGSEPLF